MSANEMSANRLNNIGFIFQNNPMIESKMYLIIAFTLKIFRNRKENHRSKSP